MIPLLPLAWRWHRLSLRAQSKWKRWRRRRRARGALAGTCPLCDRTARFFAIEAGPRETPMCVGCGSVARQRALVHVLAELDVALATARVHESSPSLGTYEFFARRCKEFVPSYFLPSRRPGKRIGAFTVADLTAQPFADGTFDLVVTLDVLEHVPTPDVALREIARTLRPGGAFVFTVPRELGRPTRARAEPGPGGWRHLLPPEHHRDPTTRRGALVVTDWGSDLEARVTAAGMACEVRVVREPRLGVPEPIDVFVARKPPAASDTPPTAR